MRAAASGLYRHGVKPQVARQIMRHSDYKTTLKHYTVLGLDDTAAAIQSLPDISSPSEANAAGMKATGTDGQSFDPQQYPQQPVRETVRNHAIRRKDHASTGQQDASPSEAASAGHCNTTRSGATVCDNPAGVAQLVERQLPKLNVEGSSPFTRFRHN